MTCEHTGKAFYERKKQIFRDWYWSQRGSQEFRDKMKEKSRVGYKKSKENLKMLKDVNKELEEQNDILRSVIEDLKDIIEFESIEENNI